MCLQTLNRTEKINEEKKETDYEITLIITLIVITFIAIITGLIYLII